VRDQQLRDAWHARECAVSISPSPTFKPEGLVLGAGTVLLRSEGQRRLQSLRGQEARVLALLSAAYGRAVAPAVLGNIERAEKAWRDGEECLAHIHLAHSGLRAPNDVRAAAYRLLMAESAMQAGLSPRAVFQALRIDESYSDAVEKAYNPAEPRVPAGSGRTSGQWTDSEQTGAAAAAIEGTAGDGSRGLSSLAGRMPTRAASLLGELSAAQVAELGAYALRILGPAGAAAAVFGLLFIPSPNNVRAEGEVRGIPGLRYSWKRDERLLHLTYDDPDGTQRSFSAHLGGDVFREENGRVIGRVVSGSNVAIDAAAVSPDLVDEGQPRLCPDPAKDRRTNDWGLDYENYIKSIVNPGNPTLPYMGYKLSNVARAVSFDDCEHSTGTMIEIKDGYAGFLRTDWGKAVVAAMFLKQATDQILAAGTRPVRWYFSQKQVADYAAKKFRDAGNGLQYIEIKFEPWPGRKE